MTLLNGCYPKYCASVQKLGVSVAFDLRVNLLLDAIVE